MLVVPLRGVRGEVGLQAVVEPALLGTDLKGDLALLVVRPLVVEDAQVGVEAAGLHALGGVEVVHRAVVGRVVDDQARGEEVEVLIEVEDRERGAGRRHAGGHRRPLRELLRLRLVATFEGGAPTIGERVGQRAEGGDAARIELDARETEARLRADRRETALDRVA